MAAKNKDLAIKIIHEAIGLLGANKVRALTNDYINSALFDGIIDGRTPEDAFDDAISRGGLCNVCALGSVFVARFTLGAMGKTGRAGDRGYQMRRDLNDVFSRDTLYLMEIAFEEAAHPSMRSTAFDAWAEVHEMEALHAKSYVERNGLKDLSEKDRLLNILGNMLENDGEFVP